MFHMKMYLSTILAMLLMKMYLSKDSDGMNWLGSMKITMMAFSLANMLFNCYRFLRYFMIKLSLFVLYKAISLNRHL